MGKSKKRHPTQAASKRKKQKAKKKRKPTRVSIVTPSNPSIGYDVLEWDLQAEFKSQQLKDLSSSMEANSPPSEHMAAICSAAAVIIG